MTGRDFLERYGVSLAVLAILAIILAVVPSNAPEQEAASEIVAGGQPVTAGAQEDPAQQADITEAAAGTVSAPAVPEGEGDAGGAGTQSEPPHGAIFGQGLCREDGRQEGISIYAPPCATWEGSNGGATARGVTDDQILVVRYLGQLDPGTRAILTNAGLSDAESVRRPTYEALLRYFNHHTQTYGREVVFRNVNASGAVENEEAMRADAVRIANDIGAFAVIDGAPDEPIPKVLGQELAQRGVICICAGSLSSGFYQENPPYLFATLPTSTEYATHIGEFIGKRLAGSRARWAGDQLNPTQNYQSQERRFGLIYIEGRRGRVDPEGKRARDAIVNEMTRHGASITADFAYLYEGGRNAQDVTAAITRMKNAGVTTLMLLTDPLYPILITQEATRQAYFPEWFITGLGLSDTTTAARLYDQLQWRHAFGISPLWVTWETVARSPGFRMWRHGGGTGEPGVLVNVYAAAIGPIFTGIHMAGPNLTPDTFAQGMFAYPETGGKPAAPLVYYTREFPMAFKDFTEIWYDADRRGPDEREERGTGMIMKVDGGKRYKPGEWPASQPKAFVSDGTEIAVSDNPPGGGDPDHEQDGHSHQGRCMACPG